MDSVKGGIPWLELTPQLRCVALTGSSRLAITSTTLWMPDRPQVVQRYGWDTINACGLLKAGSSLILISL